MKRPYEILLRLYPRDYRARFGSEMSNAFEEAASDRRQLGGSVYARFVIAELVGLMIGAGIEWIVKLTTDASVRGRSLPDLLLMRPPGVSWEAHYRGARLHLPEEVSKAQQQTEVLVERMVHAIAQHDYPGARRYSDQKRQARENLRTLRQKYQLND